MKIPAPVKLNLFEKPLPFDHVVLVENVLEQVSKLTESWAKKHIPIDPGQQQTVVSNLKHCSPEGASAREVELPTLFLVWFFATNDIKNGPRRAEILERLGRLAAENGRAPDADDKLSTGTVAFFEAVRSAYPPDRLHRFFGFVSDLLEATRRESLVDSLPSRETYEKLRTHTIAALPYIELFRLALGADLPADSAHRFDVLERHADVGVYLVNDMLSLERDLRKDKLNMVRVIANEKNISLDEAMREVEEATIETFDAMSAELDRLLRVERRPSRRRYGAFLASMQEGNRCATLALRERYFKRR